nr:protein transport protein sec31-like [Aegilops tauschii subsp. strangulata]
MPLDPAVAGPSPPDLASSSPPQAARRSRLAFLFVIDRVPVDHPEPPRARCHSPTPVVSASSSIPITVARSVAPSGSPNATTATAPYRLAPSRSHTIWPRPCPPRPCASGARAHGNLPARPRSALPPARGGLGPCLPVLPRRGCAFRRPLQPVAAGAYRAPPRLPKAATARLAGARAPELPTPDPVAPGARRHHRSAIAKMPPMPLDPAVAGPSPPDLASSSPPQAARRSRLAFLFVVDPVPVDHPEPLRARCHSPTPVVSASSSIPITVARSFAPSRSPNATTATAPYRLAPSRSHTIWPRPCPPCPCASGARAHGALPARPRSALPPARGGLGPCLLVLPRRGCAFRRPLQPVAASAYRAPPRLPKAATACLAGARAPQLPTPGAAPSRTDAPTLPGLSAIKATMTPDSFHLLRESISTHQTPSLHSATPLRTATINVEDEAPLH